MPRSFTVHGCRDFCSYMPVAICKSQAKRSSILVLTFRKKDGKPVWRFDIKNNAEQFLEQVDQSSFLQARNDWTTRSSSVLRFNVESGVY